MERLVSGVRDPAGERGRRRVQSWRGGPDGPGQLPWGRGRRAGLWGAGRVEEGRSGLEEDVFPAPCQGCVGTAGPRHWGSCGIQAGFRAPGRRQMERRGQRTGLQGPVVEAAEESRRHPRSRIGRVGPGWSRDVQLDGGQGLGGRASLLGAAGTHSGVREVGWGRGARAPWVLLALGVGLRVSRGVSGWG